MNTEKKTLQIEKSEITANKYTYRCQIVMTIIISFTVLLNVMNIFIIDERLMFTSEIGVLICLLASTLVMKLLKDSVHTKYIMIFIMVVFVTIIGVFLTYHTLLISCIPILCSAQYKNKRMIYYSFGISVVSMFIIVMAGYYFGLCDANMLALTSTTMDKYVDESAGRLLFTTPNPNPWATLPLYYFFPRCLVMYATVPLISHISDVMSENAIREQELKKKSETDTMTQLYNRNKYLDMIKDYYPSVSYVGAIFWDVNDLKKVNDNMGHEYGDHLITSIASSIVENISEDTVAYRVGGDEFVVIMENPTEEIITEFIDKCKRSINRKNKVSKVTLSAAVGYSMGDGKDIEDIIAKADDNMYIDKQNIKRSKSL